MSTWILTESELPNDDRGVLINIHHIPTKSNTMYIGCKYGTNWELDTEDGEVIYPVNKIVDNGYYVSHWRELPEYPEF